MKWVAQIDGPACIAHGDCALLAPAVFEVHDVARVIGDAPVEVLIEAAESCPTGAISVVDADMGEQIYP
jgi:ferredoxin